MRSVLSSCCPILSVTQMGGNVKSIHILVLSNFFSGCSSFRRNKNKAQKLTGHLGCRPDREQEPKGPVQAAGDWKLAGKSCPRGRGSPGAGSGTSLCLSFPNRQKEKGGTCHVMLKPLKFPLLQTAITSSTLTLDSLLPSTKSLL